MDVGSPGPSSASPFLRRCRGMLIDFLYKVVQEVHPGLGAERTAVEHVEQLLFGLLADICAVAPHTVQEVARHVQTTFPPPINDWAIKDAQEALPPQQKNFTGKKLYRSAKLVMQPVLPKLHALLKEYLDPKTDERLTLYILAILEYIAGDVLKLTGQFVKNQNRNNQITLQDLKVALRADQVLLDMFYHEPGGGLHGSASGGGLSTTTVEVGDDADDNAVVPSPVLRTQTSITYEKTARDLIHKEKQFEQDLNALVYVFRKAFAEAVGVGSLLEDVFGNVLDVHELCVRLLRLLEHSVEMSDSPCVGGVFLELVEGMEFSIFEDYAEKVLAPTCAETIERLLLDERVKTALQDRGSTFPLMVRYVLPFFLQVPVLHYSEYVDHFKALLALSDSETDREDLVSCQSYITLLQMKMEPFVAALKRNSNWLDTFQVFQSTSQQSSVFRKMGDIQQSIEGWEGPAIVKYCTHFVREGDLAKVRYNYASKLSTGSSGGFSDTLRSKSSSRNWLTERRLFLFDNLVVLAKPLPRRSAADATSIAGAVEFKFKEKFPMRKAAIVDRADTDDLKHAFEIRWKDVERSDEVVILAAKSHEEKQSWMCSLVMLHTRSMMDRLLQKHLAEEKKRTPLVLPSADVYRFSGPDLEESIVFEDYISSSGIPVVKAGTVVKLVERLTYHLYTDNKYLHTFLTTYRSFCAPKELLALLVERFEIPTPSLSLDTYSIDDGSSAPSLGGGYLESQKEMEEQAMQRFTKEYLQPVQIRVLAVISAWVVRHWYDFAKDTNLLDNLKAFLADIQSNYLKKWVTSIQKNIVLKIQQQSIEHTVDLNATVLPSNIGSLLSTDICHSQALWHTAEPFNVDEYDLMTLHPLEIGRQVTLLESDLYRAVKPVELVGAAWMKADKEVRSPQLLKLTSHSNMITFWVERQLVETGNVDERTAMLARVLDVMSAFEQLNNFNGLTEFYSALNSAAVYRLNHSWERLDMKKRAEFDHFKKLLGDPHGKPLKQRLRQINPPCVPFFGQYLSTIVFLEAGNPKYFNDPELSSEPTSDAQPLISFQKCRKIANVISEIQMYQNGPYADIQPELTIRRFFESLNPLAEFADQNALEAYLYKRSVEIEPKDVEAPTYFAPKRRPQDLKSPGVRLSKAQMQAKTTQNKAHPPQHHFNTTGRTRHHDDGGMPTGSVGPLTHHHHQRTTVSSVNGRAPVKAAVGSDGGASPPCDFSIVEIRPGLSPRYVEDVSVDMAGGGNLAKRRHGTAAMRRALSPPTLSSSANRAPHRRPRTFGEMASSPSSNSPPNDLPPPPLPPRARSNSSTLRKMGQTAVATNSASPRSPMSPPQVQQISPFKQPFIDAVDVNTFVFPPLQCATLPAAPPKRPPKKTAATTSFAAVALTIPEAAAPTTTTTRRRPPDLPPPRQTTGSATLPAPLSPTAVQRVIGAADDHEETRPSQSVGALPPVLPPKRHSQPPATVTPPPRPPKRDPTLDSRERYWSNTLPTAFSPAASRLNNGTMSTDFVTSSPPPLPPKTYKQQPQRLDEPLL